MAASKKWKCAALALSDCLDHHEHGLQDWMMPSCVHSSVYVGNTWHSLSTQLPVPVITQIHSAAGRRQRGSAARRRLAGGTRPCSQLRKVGSRQPVTPWCQHWMVQTACRLGVARLSASARSRWHTHSSQRIVLSSAHKCRAAATQTNNGGLNSGFPLAQDGGVKAQRATEPAHPSRAGRRCRKVERFGDPVASPISSYGQLTV